MNVKNQLERRTFTITQNYNYLNCENLNSGAPIKIIYFFNLKLVSILNKPTLYLVEF